MITVSGIPPLFQAAAIHCGKAAEKIQNKAQSQHRCQGPGQPLLVPVGPGPLQWDPGIKKPQQPAHTEHLTDHKRHYQYRRQRPRSQLSRCKILQGIQQRRGCQPGEKQILPSQHCQQHQIQHDVPVHLPPEIPVSHPLDHRVRIQLRGGGILTPPDVEGTRDGPGILPPQLPVGLNHLLRRPLFLFEQGLHPVPTDERIRLFKNAAPPCHTHQTVSLTGHVLQPGLVGRHIVDIGGTQFFILRILYKAFFRHNCGTSPNRSRASANTSNFWRRFRLPSY